MVARAAGTSACAALLADIAFSLSVYHCFCGNGSDPDLTLGRSGPLTMLAVEQFLLHNTILLQI